MEIDDKKKLNPIQNFQLQLWLLREHLIDADVYDIFNIIIPLESLECSFRDSTSVPQPPFVPYEDQFGCC
jgi:hypothetical protein